MISNMLIVNYSKTKFLILANKQQFDCVNIPFIHVGEDQITPVTWVRNLDVILTPTWKWICNSQKPAKRLLSSSQHQENSKIPELGGHVHNYTCICHKPDWLLQQFDEWTTRESHQETTVCAKHSCQTSFQSKEMWSHNSCTRYASLASSQIPDWIQNTVDHLQGAPWQGTYLHPRNNRPIKKQTIFLKIQWRTCPESSKIQAFSKRSFAVYGPLTWNCLQRKLGYVMKLKHSSET